MKAQSHKYKIVTTDLGKTWQIISQETGKVVKICKSYKVARSWHHALTYGLKYRQSARMTN